MPKPSVSRSIARLEHELSTRLVQRTPREMRLTPSGVVLRQRCISILKRIDQAVDDGPRGLLRITSGIGFGVNVLGHLLPLFTERHPHVSVALELTSRNVDLVAEEADLAIRIGPMNDSEMVSTHLGTVYRYTCASPIYLQRRGGQPGSKHSQPMT